MKIIVDGDGCPVVDIVQSIAKQYHLQLIVVADVNHMIYLEYGKLVIVDQGFDHADYEVLKRVESGDIVVTQDYGLASLCLAKCAYVIHQDGLEYTEKNIEGLLFHRYVGQKMSHSKMKFHHKGPKKRNMEDNIHFSECLSRMIESHL